MATAAQASGSRRRRSRRSTLRPHLRSSKHLARRALCPEATRSPNPDKRNYRTNMRNALFGIRTKQTENLYIWQQRYFTSSCNPAWIGFPSSRSSCALPQTSLSRAGHFPPSSASPVLRTEPSDWRTVSAASRSRDGPRNHLGSREPVPFCSESFSDSAHYHFASPVLEAKISGILQISLECLSLSLTPQ